MLLAGADGKARHHQAASMRAAHREAMPSAMDAKCDSSGLLQTQSVSRESVAGSRAMSDSWRARDVQGGVAHCRLALPEVAVSSVSLHGLQHLKQYRWRPMFNDRREQAAFVTTDKEKQENLLQATLSLLAH